MRLIFLGTGTSFGVPQVGCSCRTCTSTDPRDKRTRTAALVEAGGRRLLIDTPPELRLQLVAAGVPSVDAVLFTHGHADHVYIFDPAVPALPGTTKPELHAHALEPDRETEIAGVAVRPLQLPHGPHPVFGYRVGPIAYLTDAKAIPDVVRVQLGGLEVLVLNGLLSRPHPLHLSIPEAVTAAQEIGARRTFLTHLTHETPHAELQARLPAGIAPAYDGLAIEVDAA